jgi:hypothetical protein
MNADIRPRHGQSGGLRHCLLVALLIPAACAAQTTDVARPLTMTATTVGSHTATNPAGAFEHYRTFSFGASEGPPSGYEWSARTGEIQRRLRSLIAAELTGRGYAEVAEKGDILVMFGAGRREVSTSPLPTSHATTAVGPDWLPDDESADFVEGALVVDAFDGSYGNKIWHGATQAHIEPSRIDIEQLRRSVQKLVTSFPAASSP